MIRTSPPRPPSAPAPRPVFAAQLRVGPPKYIALLGWINILR
jgi:hypothetical protein